MSDNNRPVAPTIYASMGVVEPTLESIYAWAIQVTQVLNALTGHTGRAGWANQTIITYQDSKAIADPPRGSKDGDRWLQLPTLASGQTVNEYVWTRGAWVAIT